MYKKYLILTVIFFSLFFINSKALAETLKQTYDNSVWYAMSGGGKPYFSRQYVSYEIEGKVVYCIQPGVEINTDDYIGNEGIGSSPYDEKINKKIELIGYYGYDYPNHQTLKYRMATQALIWEIVSGQKVEFWTKQYSYGDNINVDYEKNEIMKLVNNHYSKISFNDIELKVDEEQIFDNEILKDYELVDSEYLEAKIEENKLYIKALKPGNLKLNLKKKNYDNNITIIYKGNGIESQNVGFFRISDPILTSINIYSKGKIEIKKLGEVTKFNNNILSYDYESLSGVEFSLYAFDTIKDFNGNIIYNKDELINVSKSNELGLAIFDDLYLGKYKIKETKTIDGYILDNKEYIVDVNSLQNKITLEIKNELEKNIVEVPNTLKNNNKFINCIIIVIGLMVCAKKI